MFSQSDAEPNELGLSEHADADDSAFQPTMTQMRGVQESLHSDIAPLDSRFEDMPSSEHVQQLETRQQQLEQRFDTFNTIFIGFSDHFYSVFPAPVPPPEFYPHQPFYPPPPPPPPPPMD